MLDCSYHEVTLEIEKAHGWIRARWILLITFFTFQPATLLELCPCLWQLQQLSSLYSMSYNSDLSKHFSGNQVNVTHYWLRLTERRSLLNNLTYCTCYTQFKKIHISLSWEFGKSLHLFVIWPSTRIMLTSEVPSNKCGELEKGKKFLVMLNVKQGHVLFINERNSMKGNKVVTLY